VVAASNWAERQMGCPLAVIHRTAITAIIILEQIEFERKEIGRVHEREQLYSEAP
jgi:hypothetical protein